MGSCINISIGRVAKGTCQVREPRKTAAFDIGCDGKNGCVEVDVPRRSGQIVCKPTRKDIRVTIGIVCDANVGASILCGSDGALITLDGKYLIVKRV